MLLKCLLVSILLRSEMDSTQPPVHGAILFVAEGRPERHQKSLQFTKSTKEKVRR